MTSLHQDDKDKQLINLLQIDFPLTVSPFAAMAEKLAVSEAEVIQRIQGLKERCIVRLIGPVMEARKLGYQTTLIAMSVPGNKINKAEKIITAHPAISHAYEREHRLNLWVTFAAPSQADIYSGIGNLAAEIASDETLILPALRIFKIGAYFSMGSEGEDNEETMPVKTGSSLPEPVALSGRDRQVLNILQQDLPLVHRPFSGMAAEADLKTDAFLRVVASLLERGVLRRYSASINHRNAGYRANAMTCWLATASTLEKSGRKMAEMKQVSHCYERRTYASWPYNLYTMTHARSREACQELIAELSRRTGLSDYIVLFSTREFKKTRIKYTV